MISKSDSFGIILCFFIVLVIEIFYAMSGGYGPLSYRGNMAASDEEIKETIDTMFKISKGER